MVSTSSVNATALLVLQQSAPLPTSRIQTGTGGNSLLAVANGVSSSGHVNKARGKIAEALFDRTTPDVTEMKVHLMKRLGEKFGLSMDDFDSPRAYGAAIREAIGHLKQQPGGSLALAEMEKDLGLDKLGISLDTVVDAIINPGRESDQKLDAALREQLGKDAGDHRASDARKGIPKLQADGIGLYGF